MKSFILNKIKNYLSENKLVSSLLVEQRIKMDISVPSEIQLIKDVIKKHGFKLYLVGGSVRDALLGKEPKDFDLATDAIPDKVIEILKPQPFVDNILETGKDFGVVNVIIGGEEFEIATFRADSVTGDGRRPDSVEFTDIETDVKRRDLTINALFYDLDTHEVVDLVGGISDLKNGIVRTVGSAEERFNEDRLRILRAIRFAARFGSNLDPAVDAALKKDSSMDKISNERIRDEFLKGVKSAKSVKHFLKMLKEYDLLKWVFKGLNVASDFIEERDHIVLLTYILRNNSPQSIQKGLHGMTYTSDEIKAILFLNSLQVLITSRVYKLKKAQQNSGVSDEQIRNFGKLIGIDSTLLETFINFKLSVTGKQIMDTGIKAGPEIGIEIEKLEIQKFLASIAT